MLTLPALCAYCCPLHCALSGAVLLQCCLSPAHGHAPCTALCQTPACLNTQLSPQHGVQVVQHGACLGIGIAGLGNNDSEIFEVIKNIMYTDGAISGEAAGLALGLLFVGSGTDKSEELLAYAHDTQHEKVCCCCACGTDRCSLLAGSTLGWQWQWQKQGALDTSM